MSSIGANSIFLIQSKDSTNQNFGTCFLFYKNEQKSYFISCAHVVVDCGGSEKILINKIPAKVITPIDLLESIDLAILSVDESFPYPILKIGNVGRINNSIELVGYQKIKRTYIVRTINGILKDEIFFQIDENNNRFKAWDIIITSEFNLQPGNSGSPIINSDFKVNAILSHKFGSDNKKGIAIDIYSVLYLLKVYLEFGNFKNENEELFKYVYECKSELGNGLESLRNAEIQSVQNIISDASPKINVLWITGIPGSGKTFFSYSLIKRWNMEENYIYIPEGNESSSHRFIENIKSNIPDEFFKYYQNSDWSIKDPDIHIKNSLIAAIEASTKSEKILIFEFVDDNFLSDENSILYKLCNRIKPNSKIKLIFNSYSINDKLPINHAEFQLPKLEYNEAFQICHNINAEIKDSHFKEIYKKFDGHVLSLISWARNKEYDSTEVPIQTIERFQLIWLGLSNAAKQVYMAVSKEPNIAIPYLLDYNSVDELIGKGLMNRFPQTKHGIAFYIHNLVLNACKNLYSEDERINATNKILLVAINKRLYHFVPKLIINLLNLNKLDKANQLIIDHGRDIIETSSIQESREFLSIALLNLNSESDGYFYCKYLEALLYLFEGNYTKSQDLFQLILSNDFSYPVPFMVAINLEIIENLRRQGKIGLTVQSFSEVFPIFNTLKKSKKSIDNHLLGVSAFLTGHFYRHFGDYYNSIKYYEMAEKLFLDKKNCSNKIEALHCAYSKSISYFTKQNTLYDYAKYGVLIDNTRSNFLKGLFHLTKCKLDVSNNNIPDALSEIELAKENFKYFGSILYYQRCCCVKALIGLYIEDQDLTAKSLAEIPNQKEATRKIFILKTILLGNPNELELNKSLINENLCDLLENGNTISAFSFYLILKLRNLIHLLLEKDIKVATLLSDKNDFKLTYKYYKSYSEFEIESSNNILAKKNFSEDELKQLIFLFD